MAGRLDIYEGVIKLKDEFSGNLEKARLKMLGFDSTNKVTMANMGRLAGIGFGALVAGGAAAGGTMALLAQQTAETGDHFAKLSQKTGMTTEFLSGLNHAMEMSGGNTTQMAMALKGFEKRMVFATEGVNEYSRAYDTLGISVKDQSGNLKKSEDLLMEVADKFAKLKDGAQKTTLAVKIFNDEGGLAMIPMLNEGAAGIKKLTEEAERLGLVWSGEDAAAAAQFSDQLDLLTKAGTGLAQTIGKELIPYGIALVRNFQEWTSGAQGFTGLHLDEHIKTIDAALVGVTPVVKTFAVGGLTIAQAFDSAGRLLGNFAATAQALARGDLKVALAMATDPGDPSAWDDYMSRVQAILNAEAPKLSSILSPQQIEVSVKAKADTSGGMDLPVLGKPQKEEDAQAVWAAYVARLEAMGQARDQEIAQEVADMEEFYRRLEEMGQGRVRQTVAEAEAIARNHEMALELGLVSEEQAAAASKA
ncbi:MAG: hypothetical protein OEY28_06100, partial [Nitrospira sp.]|nr:hypothetical protein [Nitrospira sp.]